MDNKGACHVETKNNMYCRLWYRKCLTAVNKGPGNFQIFFTTIAIVYVVQKTRNTKLT